MKLFSWKFLGSVWFCGKPLILGGPVSPPTSSHPERVQEQAEDEGQLGGVEEVLNGEAICHVGEGAVVEKRI